MHSRFFTLLKSSTVGSRMATIWFHLSNDSTIHCVRFSVGPALKTDIMKVSVESVSFVECDEFDVQGLFWPSSSQGLDHHDGPPTCALVIAMMIDDHLISVAFACLKSRSTARVFGTLRQTSLLAMAKSPLPRLPPLLVPALPACQACKEQSVRSSEGGSLVDAIAGYQFSPPF